ncbi:YqzL family protein [Pradoshia sp. D12]|nr:MULTISPECIES: YqzL family protein [Bacillaceae]OCA86435.1 YqzL family protein [Bacillus sp. FJAT-27986]QFK72234.1 YqzL family protein [Pradoshia sp. D12]TPF71273.1 YqzL family protein [Bacillus sp. D12]
MISFTWNVFRQTGSVDTYLLFKELERQNEGQPDVIKEDHEEMEIPII